MDTLTAYPEVLGYRSKSPAFLSYARPALLGIDLRVRMGMFEEELTPVVPAIFSLTASQNDADHPALL